MHKIVLGCGAGCLCLVVGPFIALVVAIELGFVPDPMVLRESEIPDRQLEKLVEMDVIDPYEQVLYFYSWGMVSIEVGGVLVTPERLAIYFEEDDQPSVWSVDFEDVESIELTAEDSYWEDAVLTVDYRDGEGEEYSLELWVSTYEDRHEELLVKLREMASEARAEVLEPVLGASED